MNSRRLGTGLLVATALAAAWHETPAQTKSQDGALAKANIAKATAEAKNWRGDAFLIQVNSVQVMDGTAFWEYVFWSTSARRPKNGLQVSYGRAGKKYVSETDVPLTKPDGERLDDFAVDSDQAITIARKAGLKQAALSMYLMMFSGRPLWMVQESSEKSGEDSQVFVDAITGKAGSKTLIWAKD